MGERRDTSNEFQPPPAARRIFCNRTLNLRAIGAIGYDMDYTLVHYHVEHWEQKAYEHLRRKLAARGWPVEDLKFDAQMVSRGLVVDIDLGNVLKANRFGYVKKAYHGTRELVHEELRRIYALTFVDLAEERYVFANTLFSLSEICMYAQLVELLDAGELSAVLGYADLYRAVRRSLDEAHLEGLLKAEILAQPQRFIDLDQETPLALLDQKHAGKRLMLITNSEWSYTRSAMSYAFDALLPKSTSWRDLFELVIVSARKPSFFAARGPMFQVVDEEGLLRPVIGAPSAPGIYLGGNAVLVEAYLGLKGDQILYVGDHIFVDVHQSKSLLRWRTALVLRELEQELAEIEAFRPSQQTLTDLMRRKEALEFEYFQLKLQAQRISQNYGPSGSVGFEALDTRIREVKQRLVAADLEISPLAHAASTLSNERWGLLLRTGNDKSHLARQIERYADVYMSRVSNFLYVSPFVYLRSPHGSLPHDPG